MLGSTQQNSHNSSSSNQPHKQLLNIKEQLQQFLLRYPPPNDKVIEELHQLTENLEDSQWLKGNATFAYQRVMEVKERFSYYTKLLDEQLQAAETGAGQKGEEEEEHENVVRENVVRVEVDFMGEDEPDGSFGQDKTIRTWDSEEDILHSKGEVTLRHPRKSLAGQNNSSLCYDNIGVGVAMKLLLTADAKLQPLGVCGGGGG